MSAKSKKNDVDSRISRLEKMMESIASKQEDFLQSMSNRPPSNDDTQTNLSVDGDRLVFKRPRLATDLPSSVNIGNSSSIRLKPVTTSRPIPLPPSSSSPGPSRPSASSPGPSDNCSELDFDDLEDPHVSQDDFDPDAEWEDISEVDNASGRDSNSNDEEIPILGSKPPPCWVPPEKVFDWFLKVADMELNDTQFKELEAEFLSSDDVSTHFEPARLPSVIWDCIKTKRGENYRQRSAFKIQNYVCTALKPLLSVMGSLDSTDKTNRKLLASAIQLLVSSNLQMNRFRRSLSLTNVKPEYRKKLLAQPLTHTELFGSDFEKTSVPNWVEILSGGPPKDGIPALDAPSFVRASGKTGIDPTEPVITLEMGAQARAYPIRYLTWHEIVNDTVGDIPVAVTFCPLCNSGITFDRRVGGQVLSFGVSGKLRNSDMVMYDRQTESWWQQAIGEGIVGEMTGVELTQFPSWMESWAEFVSRHPDGLVMAEPDFNRDYGRNPYRGYDSSTRPFLYSGELPPHGIDALARVVRVGDRAWPMARLAEEGEVREAGVVISWRPGQASALDTGRIGNGRDVGSIRVRDGQGRDLAHDVMFAFAYHAFWPDGAWMLGQ